MINMASLPIPLANAQSHRASWKSLTPNAKSKCMIVIPMEVWHSIFTVFCFNLTIYSDDPVLYFYPTTLNNWNPTAVMDSWQWNLLEYLEPNVLELDLYGKGRAFYS
jgi:hypothetical protein